MEPLHVLEYELSSELATIVQRALLGFELRRGWKRDLPMFAAALAFAALIVVPVTQGWILPGVGGGLLCVLALCVMGKVWRRRWLAYTTTTTAILPVHTLDRHVRIEFHDQSVRMETEFFRGEGAWAELDEIILFPAFWALYLSNGGQIVLPIALVKPELEAFLFGKAEQVMAAVIRQ